MSKSAQQEINSIANELQSIIIELGDISQGVRNDFRNIGNERCALAIDSVRDKYKSVKTDILRV